MRIAHARPIIRRPAASLVALALAVLVVSPIHGQDPVERDPLMASLLQPEDLPAGFTTIGPEEGSQFDIDSGAFSEAGGVRVVSQAWSSETSGVVFDFRMELPSAEAAARYLEEAEPTLSEADVTGLSLETEQPPVGQDARHYTGVTRVGDAAITFDNYLFHVGPVAAKVFVAAVDLPDGEARRLAEMAAARMAPFAALDQPTPQATPDPTERLLALVPDAIAGSCEPFSSGTSGQLAALTCGEDDLLVYSSFAAAGPMADAFEELTSAIPPDGRAASCAEGAHLGPYPTAGTPTGRVACWDPPGDGLVLFWTDDEHLVIGGILADTADYEKLDAAWQAASLR
jgi:hypothetical protein